MFANCLLVVKLNFEINCTFLNLNLFYILLILKIKCSKYMIFPFLGTTYKETTPCRRQETGLENEDAKSKEGGQLGRHWLVQSVQEQGPQNFTESFRLDRIVVRRPELRLEEARPRSPIHNLLLTVNTQLYSVN